MMEKRQLEQERVVLVALMTQNQGANEVTEFLEELAFLTDTAGGEVVQKFVQSRECPHPKTFVGTGKLAEIGDFIAIRDVGTVIFDDELSPAQLRNIERILKCKILDRTHLILDIFAQRAKTSYARTQVELAQCEYWLPRLTRLWTHLDKQKGGIGLRGPGETEIETDRRIVRDQIALLKKKLQRIDRQMYQQRRHRGKMVRVALVGYTNVGKSTLMNLMSKSDVFAENKLFATLDTTVRKVVIDNIPFLMTDTVGFIRKLPTQLVASFKSTLDEVRDADLLLHVVAIAHPNFQDHISAVERILMEIGALDKPMIYVFNKIDRYVNDQIATDDLVTEKSEQQYTLEDWKQTWMSKKNTPAVFVSATQKRHIDVLRATLYEAVKKIHVQRFPYNDFLYEEMEEDKG